MSRLSAADYQAAALVIAELAGPYYARRAREEWEQCNAQLQPIIGLLDQLVSAANPGTRSAASDALQRIESAIGAAALQQLRTTRQN